MSTGLNEDSDLEESVLEMGTSTLVVDLSEVAETRR